MIQMILGLPIFKQCWDSGLKIREKYKAFDLENHNHMQQINISKETN